MLQARPEWHVICEVSDGLEAVQKTEELKPDLILLDIGLSGLNGIETARRIRKLVPESKILFLSQQSDADVVQEALSLGSGYVVKECAVRELLPAVDAVLLGKRFVSGSVADRDHLREGVRGNTYFHFEFDPESMIVQGKFHDPVTSESIKDYYRAATSLAANLDFRGSITDFSGATQFDVSPVTIRELAALSPVDPVVSRPRVIIAPSPLIFGLARIFQVTGKATRPNLHVVRNQRQAIALLGITTPRFQPIQ